VNSFHLTHIASSESEFWGDKNGAQGICIATLDSFVILLRNSEALGLKTSNYSVFSCKIVLLLPKISLLVPQGSAIRCSNNFRKKAEADATSTEP
jgi:hypothetical protein